MSEKSEKFKKRYVVPFATATAIALSGCGNSLARSVEELKGKIPEASYERMIDMGERVNSDINREEIGGEENNLVIDVMKQKLEQDLQNSERIVKSVTFDVPNVSGSADPIYNVTIEYQYNGENEIKTVEYTNVGLIEKTADIILGKDQNDLPDELEKWLGVLSSNQTALYIGDYNEKLYDQTVRLLYGSFAETDNGNITFTREKQEEKEVQKE